MLKYQQIAKELFLYIENSHLKQGDQLPSLTELVKKYDTSKTTILKAIAELEKDGYIYQVQGSGTFVKNLPKSDYINFNMQLGWTSDFTKEKTTNSDVTVEKIMAPSNIAEKLQCPVDTPVFKISRVKSLHGKIFCFETSYYNSTIIPFLNDKIARESIFDYISKVFKVNVGFSDKYFSVRPLTSLEAQKLQLDSTSFGLSVHETFYSTAGNVFDYSENVYHYQNAKFYL